jgi:hypothetical protein
MRNNMIKKEYHLGVIVYWFILKKNIHLNLLTILILIFISLIINQSVEFLKLFVKNKIITKN